MIVCDPESDLFYTTKPFIDSDFGIVGILSESEPPVVTIDELSGDLVDSPALYIGIFLDDKGEYILEFLAISVNKVPGITYEIDSL